jgi:hypothetical protein
MRVTMIVLREGGRWIGPRDRKPMRGELLTKKFIAGESLVKVLEFVELCSHSGKYQLNDARVKECWQEKSTIVFSGLSQEDGAWVSQEWLVDVNPPLETRRIDDGSSRPAQRPVAIQT